MCGGIRIILGTRIVSTLVSVAGNLGEVERLILSGVPATCVDKQQRTPLHYAAYNGDRDMMALLSDFDAGIEAKDASVISRGARVYRR